MPLSLGKLLQRLICNIFRFRKCKIFFFLLFTFSVVIWEFNHVLRGNYLSTCERFDVVYTWVNGTDPAFINALRQYEINFDPARFDDKNELKYSLRSLEKFANWVNHVYIVTNGQIPYWLDLSYEKVTIVTHNEIVTDELQSLILPTFSSSAIETFLHRIPRLTKRFVYLNDDIFLGAPIYREDLYTESEGAKIFSAWTVPDCFLDCPWAYIGDGACDKHCNIAACQFDGGDCLLDGGIAVGENSPSTAALAAFVDLPITQPNQSTKDYKFLSLWNGIKTKRKISFKDVIKQKNLTTIEELRNIVVSFNEKQKIEQRASREYIEAKQTLAEPRYKSSKDIYSHSLIHTNMLLNRHYGFKSRNVMAHVGFLLDIDVINEMHKKFSEEIRATAMHRFRNPNDLQFAFLYYNFLMSETYNSTVENIFDEFDTDGSLTWSDREVRTFLSRMYPLPLDWSAVRYFEDVINNCSRRYNINNESQASFSTLVYERYEDSNVPTITRELVSKCNILSEAMFANFAQRQKYKFTVNSKRGMHSNFMMLTSNITEVVDSLDKLRRSPKKFNCINDNLEPQYREDNDLIRHLLEDFYLSFFPRTSKFELPERYRNRFTNYKDYEQWRIRKSITLFFGYSASFILVIFLLRFLFLHKAKCIRRCVESLC